MSDENAGVKCAEPLLNYTIPKKKNDCEEQKDNDKDYTPVLPQEQDCPDKPAAYAKTNANTPEKPPETPKQAAQLNSAFHNNLVTADESLPKELTMLFQPLYCKLCSVQLTSSIMAKMHYNSKNHEKKIRRFLIDYSERTGEPLHKRAKVEGSNKTNNSGDDNDPKYFHCDACDLPLTGRLHAESHYMGRNHRNVIERKKLPTGQGFYDPKGKWIRVTPIKTAADPVRGDNVGKDFIPGDSTPKFEETNIRIAPEKLRCDLCNVSATSLAQIEMHYNGQKHKKKLKQQGLLTGTGESADKSEVPKDNILTSVVNNDDKKDLSIFRTPSGYYYCKTCNITLNSEVQFKQHLGSKNHMKKSSRA